VRIGKPITVLLCALLCACTADLIDGPPPSPPSSPSPPNSAVNQSTNLTLHWNAGKTDAATFFDVYLGTRQPLKLVGDSDRVASYRPYNLRRNTTYQWRVVTFTASGSTTSETWSFTTTAGGSPGIPVNDWPRDGSDFAAEFVDLQWTGSDPDGDDLLYDVYFGKQPNPPLVSAGITDRDVREMLPERGTYYWRIVAHDTFGLTTEGPTWTFHAVPIPGHIYNWGGTGVAGTNALGQPPLQTQLYWPVDVTIARDGTPYVVDWNNHRIISTDASGNFKLIAGVEFGDPCLSAPPGCQNLVAAQTPLNQPSDVTFDASGNLTLSAWHSSQLFRINLGTGLMDRACGVSRSFSPDGTRAATTNINLVASAAYDSHGLLYYTDQQNQVIRMIDGAGLVHTVAGTNPVFDPNLNGWVAQSGYAGDGGAATAALFNFDHGQLAMPSGKICFDASDNMYIADTLNHCIRRVDVSGTISLFSGPLPGSSFSPFDQPRDVAVDSHGNVIVADSGRSLVLLVKPDGNVLFFAGATEDYGNLDHDGGEATRAKLHSPVGIGVDAHDNVWIADTQGSRIRIVYR